MSAADRWRISAAASDRECTWAADELSHLRHFRALSLPEKIRALEQVAQVAAALHGRVGDRERAEERV